MYGIGCQAEADSREQIKNSIDEAKQWFGVDKKADWLGRLYQYGNRLAHVYFLRKKLGKEAWLVNLYFTDDEKHNPTSAEVWKETLSDIKRELGFGTDPIPWAVDIFLPAKLRTELCGSDSIESEITPASV